jgi:hypothetical protein
MMNEKRTGRAARRRPEPEAPATMALVWRTGTVGRPGEPPHDCPHAEGGAGVEALTPVVVATADGRDLARPADPICVACLADGCPIALARFDDSKRQRFRDAILRIGLASEVYDPLEEAFWRDRPWCDVELRKTVRAPTPDEARLYDLFERPEPLPESAGCFGALADVAFAVRLSDARARLDAWQRTKRRSEQAREWWLRVEPPPASWFGARAKLERAHAEARFDRALDVFLDGPGWRDRPRTLQERLEALVGGADDHRAPEAARSLGLRWPCTAAELKAAWRRVAKVAHPDRGGSAEAFRAAKAAHDQLARALGGQA